MIWDLDACAGRPEAGAKAELLARARALGLAVPPGVVVASGPVDEVALRRAVGRLGPGPLVVRSSSPAEDQQGRSAAGLFLSLRDVAPDALRAAVDAVHASGEDETVRRYLGGPSPVAALIQPQVNAVRLGVLVLTPGEDARCEERPPDEPEWGPVQASVVPPEETALLGGARRLARLVHGGSEGPVQIEYARLADGAVVFLQARAAPPTPARTEWPSPAAALTWILDREHNPDPLSAAQASLVVQADRVGQSLGLRQQVVHGYLYFAREPAPVPLLPVAAEDLPRVYETEVLPACDAVLAPLEERTALPEEASREDRDAEPALPELALALRAAWDAYFAVYRLYLGRVSVLLRAARDRLDGFLRAHLGERLAAHGDLLGGLSTVTLRRAQDLWLLGRAHAAERAALLDAYARVHGAAAPSWDVAVHCDEEDPARVWALAAAVAQGPEPELRRRAAERDHEAARDRLTGRLAPAARAEFLALLPAVRAALGVAEDDDALFARAQRIVRRALLGCGRALAAAGLLDQPESIFDLPIEAAIAQGVSDDGSARSDLSDLRARSSAGRAARTAAALLWPPERFVAGRAVFALPRGATLRGHGVPGRDPGPVRGRARVVRGLGDTFAPPGPGEVLVVPALLPAWAPLLPGALALVSVSGGAFSHGATLAREAGVPAVVGIGPHEIADGDELLVDAARGLVLPLRRR